MAKATNPVRDLLIEIVSAVVNMDDGDDGEKVDEDVDESRSEADSGKLINFTHTSLLVDWCQDILPSSAVISAGMSNRSRNSASVPSPLEEFNRDSVIINSVQDPGVGVVDSVRANAESFLFVDQSHSAKSGSPPLDDLGQANRRGEQHQHHLDLGVIINDPFVSDSINMEQEQHIGGPFSPQENWSQQVGPVTQHMDQEHMSFGGGPPPPSMGNERAQMWQQNHYMGGDPRVTESGFISGNNTGPSSVTGHEDADAEYLGSGAASTLYDLDSLPQSELSSLASSQNIPAFDPDESIPKLIETLKDDDPIVVDVSFKSLEGYSRSDKFKWAITTHKMSDELTMCLSGELLRATKYIMSVQEGQQDPQEMERMQQRAKSASKILSILSTKKARCPVIVESDALSAFSFLLGSPDRLRIYACTTVHNIVMDMDKPTGDERERALRAKAMDTLRRTRGDEALCRVLQNAMEQSNEKLMTIAVDCLRILSVGSAETKRRLLGCGIPQLAVKILSGNLQETVNRNLIVCTLRLLKVLSTCAENKEVIIRNGGIAALSKYLGCTREKILNYCACTLRNLSDCIHKLMHSGEMRADDPDVLFTIGQLVKLLNHEKPDVFTVAADILFNLVLAKDACKIETCSADGIIALTNILKNWEQRTYMLSGKSAKDLMVAVVGTLKHVTYGHPMTAQAQAHFLSSSPDAFSCLLNLLKCLTQPPHGKQHNLCPVHKDLRLLSCGDDGKVVAPGGGWVSAQQQNQQQQSSWGPIKDILCLIRNFAQLPNNLGELRRQSVVSTMVDLAIFVKTFLPPGNSNGGSNPLPKEVLAAEACLDILFFVSKDPANWTKEMAKPDLISTLTEYMKMPCESLSRRGVLILNSLTHDRNLGNIIKGNNECMDVLNRLVASTNESIAAEAIRCLDHVNNPPPPTAINQQHIQQPPPPQHFQQQQQQHRPVPPPRSAHHQHPHAPQQQGFPPVQQQPQMRARPMQQQQLHPNHGGMQPQMQSQMHPAQGFNGNRPGMDSYPQQPMPPQQQQMGYMGGPADFPPGPGVDQAEVDFLQAMGGAGGGDFNPGGGGGAGSGGGHFFDEEMMN